jgi:serine/threonine-protein kinase
VQIVEDVEVYQAAMDDGRVVALKIARPSASPATGALLAREAAILRALGGHVAPRLEHDGEHQRRRYLASAWHDGVDAGEASARLRAIGDRRAQRELRAMTLAVVDGYAHLHASGVLHGDVHPRNVVAGGGSSVTLLDFGLARHLGEPRASVPRRGVGFYFEPEYARARAAGIVAPTVTERGEQYAVGALIYFLLAGTHYVDFRLDDALWQQIAELAPIPFERRGLPSWRAGERVLGRALAKDPDERFATMADFARELRRACEDDRARAHASSVPQPADAVLGEVLARVSRDPAELALDAPSSAHSGGAGIAYLLYRVSCLRGEARPLAHADSWIEHALERCDEPSAYTAATHAPASATTSSLYHGAPGLHAVRALVSLAQDDAAGARGALDRYCVCATAPADPLDATLGGASILIGSAGLLPAYEAGGDEHAGLRAVGDSLCSSIHERLCAAGPIAGCRTLPWLGVAHGWAGAICAMLLWAEATGVQPAPGIADRLEELAAFATSAGAGLVWPRTSGVGELDRPPTPGWCHGSAGHAQMWATAHRLWGRPIYLERAEQAALHAFAAAAGSGASLCCGLAGRAYACLSLFRITGDDAWHERARRLAAYAAHAGHRRLEPNSLYAGDVGIALLAADLAEPDRSHMPLFEPDRWPARPHGGSPRPRT